MLELCRVATEEGEAKEEGEASRLDYAMARIDERSMSIASNSFECFAMQGGRRQSQNE